MAEEIALENGPISYFEGLVTLTLDRFILHTFDLRASRINLYLQDKISLKSKKLFVDGRTYAQTDI